MLGVAVKLASPGPTEKFTTREIRVALNDPTPLGVVRPALGRQWFLLSIEEIDCGRLEVKVCALKVKKRLVLLQGSEKRHRHDTGDPHDAWDCLGCPTGEPN